VDKVIIDKRNTKCINVRGGPQMELHNIKRILSSLQAMHLSYFQQRTTRIEFVQKDILGFFGR
jgi:hypothetical protein